MTMATSTAPAQEPDAFVGRLLMEGQLVQIGFQLAHAIVHVAHLPTHVLQLSRHVVLLRGHDPLLVCYCILRCLRLGLFEFVPDEWLSCLDGMHDSLQGAMMQALVAARHDAGQVLTFVRPLDLQS